MGLIRHKYVPILYMRKQSRFRITQIRIPTQPLSHATKENNNDNGKENPAIAGVRFVGLLSCEGSSSCLILVRAPWGKTGVTPHLMGGETEAQRGEGTGCRSWSDGWGAGVPAQAWLTWVPQLWTARPALTVCRSHHRNKAHHIHVCRPSGHLTGLMTIQQTHSLFYKGYPEGFLTAFKKEGGHRMHIVVINLCSMINVWS